MHLKYDIVIVGGGPSGLSAAIRLKQIAKNTGKKINVCVLEKGSEIGSHIISGAVIDPYVFNELIPEWNKTKNPINIRVNEERFLFLLKKKSIKCPTWILPKSFQNKGNFIVSLGEVVKWLGIQAEKLGVDIFCGFSAFDILYNSNGSVKGIVTGDMGINRDGIKLNNFQKGIEIHAKYTFFAEGSRGHLGKKVISRFNLNKYSNPQSYGIGIKELWEIDPLKYKPGLVIHTLGWPLKSDTYGGSFLYHVDQNKISIGFIIGIGYSNPYLSPFDEFQMYKTHPYIKYFLKKGKRISYGARSITMGGLMSIPKIIFPGGILIGDEAGFFNPFRIKGIHAAIKTGMLAAEVAFSSMENGNKNNELTEFLDKFKNSWLYKELYKSRNSKQWMEKGIYTGIIMNAVEQGVMKGHIPWTLHRKYEDHELLKLAKFCKPIKYFKPDGNITFDKLSSVQFSNTNHEENQPSHLKINDFSIPLKINLKKYAKLEERFCPASVYEFTKDEKGNDYLQINSQNCLHCKMCDIKDPNQNINWITPEGGGGPNYTNM